MNEQQKMGNVIKEAREKKGLSQGKLAKMLNVQTPVIYKYEKGLIKLIPFEKRMKIKQILNLDTGLLMYTQEIEDLKRLTDQLGKMGRHFIPTDFEDDENSILLEKIANEIEEIPLVEAIKIIINRLNENQIIDKQSREEFFNILLYERRLKDKDRESLAKYCANL